MKILIEVEAKPGETAAEAVSREIDKLVVGLYPHKVRLPGDGTFEVVAPRCGLGGTDAVLGHLSTFGMPDGDLYFEIRRKP